MPRGPAEGVVRGGVTAILPPDAFHEEAGTHDLDHVLRHIVAAHGNGTAVRFQIGNARTETPPGGDGGVERHGRSALAKELLFRRGHTPAVRGDEAVGEKVALRQVGGGLDPSLTLHGRHFSPYLIEVDGR